MMRGGQKNGRIGKMVVERKGWGIVRGEIQQNRKRKGNKGKLNMLVTSRAEAWFVRPKDGCGRAVDCSVHMLIVESGFGFIVV